MSAILWTAYLVCVGFMFSLLALRARCGVHVVVVSPLEIALVVVSLISAPVALFIILINRIRYECRIYRYEIPRYKT